MELFTFDNNSLPLIKIATVNNYLPLIVIIYR